MPNSPDIAAIAALVGDPTRGRMLTALMDGRAQTATELSLAGGVTASTASIHLGRMERAGLLAEVKQGRHRYFRLASSDVSAAIEALMRIAPQPPRMLATSGPSAAQLRHARVCYDHLAGEAAVHWFDRLRRQRLLTGADDALELSPKGRDWCARWGVDLERLSRSRRQLCRSCLDWTERRAHLAGALGAALFERMLALRLAARVRGSRRVILSARGEAWLSHPLG
jgi:DNA-binding transcriptional ArsR family regulator